MGALVAVAAVEEASQGEATSTLHMEVVVVALIHLQCLRKCLLQQEEVDDDVLEAAVDPNFKVFPVVAFLEEAVLEGLSKDNHKIYFPKVDPLLNLASQSSPIMYVLHHLLVVAKHL